MLETILWIWRVLVLIQVGLVAKRVRAVYANTEMHWNTQSCLILDFILPLRPFKLSSMLNTSSRVRCRDCLFLSVGFLDRFLFVRAFTCAYVWGLFSSFWSSYVVFFFSSSFKCRRGRFIHCRVNLQWAREKKWETFFKCVYLEDTFLCNRI